MNYFALIFAMMVIGWFQGCAQKQVTPDAVEPSVQVADTNKAALTNEEWKMKLTPDQYYVTCEGGTEKPFTGKYWDFHGEGVYHCARCGAPLFDSKTKYDSGSGWPSFTNPMQQNGVAEKPDSSFNMIRTEIICSRCGAHLGHVFPDGPAPSGMRYCVNSLSLDFKEKGK